MAAVVGSVIVMVGQLFGTIFPVWFGPDLSNYNLKCDPFSPEIKYEPMLDRECNISDGMNTTTYKIDYSKIYYNYIFALNISLIDLHPIHKFKGEVFLTSICPPGFNAVIPDPIISAKKSTNIYIRANVSHLIFSEASILETGHTYTIFIRGIGSDGSERNATAIAIMKPIIGSGIFDRFAKILPGNPQNFTRELFYSTEVVPIPIQQSLIQPENNPKKGIKVRATTFLGPATNELFKKSPSLFEHK